MLDETPADELRVDPQSLASPREVRCAAMQQQEIFGVGCVAIWRELERAGESALDQLWRHADIVIARQQARELGPVLGRVAPGCGLVQRAEQAVQRIGVRP